jgi:hypothetical protein
MVPLATPATVQPLWVQTALKALNSPCLGLGHHDFSGVEDLAATHRDVGDLDHVLARARRTSPCAHGGASRAGRTTAACRKSRCAGDPHTHDGDIANDRTAINVTCRRVLGGGELVRLAH